MPVPLPLGATAAVKLKGVPCTSVVDELRVKVVVVALSLDVIEFHWFTRFATFTDPKPEAMSYPTPAW